MAVLVKGDNLLVATQVENHQVLGTTGDLAEVCSNAPRCGDDCNLIDVPNNFHPGTEDSVVNF